MQLLRPGANIFLMAKLAVPRGMTMQDIGAAFRGITCEEIQIRLDAHAEGFIEKLQAQSGFWNG